MKKIILVMIVAILLLYLIMYISTNSVINEVRLVMGGKVDVLATKGTPLSRYNFSNVLSNAEVEVRIKRLFVLHNFFDGYVWVKYSYKTVVNDTDIMPSSANILSQWKIHKNNGKWQIVEIIENP